MKQKTSWEKESSWYSKATEGRGHYYHEHLVIPNATRLLKLGKNDSLLDLACGGGVLARAIPKSVPYLGVDVSRSLIENAKMNDRNPLHSYIEADVTRRLPTDERFSRAAIILALQNIKDPEIAIRHASDHLEEGGILVIVLNHPSFRIPRQSSWGIDEQNKMQYRKVNRYFSSLEIPITMHPGKTESSVTWSYHLPLSSYTDMLDRNGFVIKRLEEWSSDKVSEGKKQKMENRARSEFPLFMAIQAIKLSSPFSSFSG